MTTVEPQLLAMLPALMTVAGVMVLVGRHFGMLAEPTRTNCAACGRLVPPGGRCDCTEGA